MTITATAAAITDPRFEHVRAAESAFRASATSLDVPDGPNLQVSPSQIAAAKSSAQLGVDALALALDPNLTPLPPVTGMLQQAATSGAEALTRINALQTSGDFLDAQNAKSFARGTADQLASALQIATYLP